MAYLAEYGGGDGMGGMGGVPGDLFGVVHPALYNAESRRLKRSESPGMFCAFQIVS
jgi:hypothetical protein